MKKITIILFIVFHFVLQASAKQPAFLFSAPVNGNIQLLEVGKERFCIAANVIYRIEKKTLVKKMVCTDTCNEAVVYNNNIVLATKNGLQKFDIKSNTITALLPEAVKGDINHIQTDHNNHIWFTKAYEGCFMIDDNNEVLQKVKVPVTYTLAYTSNGNIWVGTNVGLYKIPVQGGEIVRYAEEGIASNELPDNLVERLFNDAQSNIWAVMPGHISFIAADSEDEFPDYEHVGKKNNELYDITAAGKAYLFATAEGILLMRDIKNGDALHTGEIHQSFNTAAYLLNDELTGKPHDLKNTTVTKIKTCGSETYFITSKGLWSMNTAKLTRALKSRFSI